MKRAAARRRRPDIYALTVVLLAVLLLAQSVQAADGGAPLQVFGCYHVSQRNTFTGRLTPAVLREVLGAAAEAAGLLPPPTAPPAPAREGG